MLWLLWWAPGTAQHVMFCATCNQCHVLLFHASIQHEAKWESKTRQAANIDPAFAAVFCRLCRRRRRDRSEAGAPAGAAGAHAVRPRAEPAGLYPVAVLHLQVGLGASRRSCLLPHAANSSAVTQLVRAGNKMVLDEVKRR